MTIESKMNYALKLADLGFSHEFEDLFKLASLCEEIEGLKLSGESASSQLEEDFSRSIKLFYKKRGAFRSEVERFILAKQLIMNIIDFG
jgi:hypothetical protein